MNNKYLVQLIAFILLGFVAVANPGKQEQPTVHPGMYQVCDTGAAVEDHAVAHNDMPVFRCNLPAKKTSTIKSRFRAVSFIQLSPCETTSLVATTVADRALKGTNDINSAHLPPFYYIFLFRLTPF